MAAIIILTVGVSDYRKILRACSPALFFLKQLIGIHHMLPPLIPCCVPADIGRLPLIPKA